MLCKLLLLVGCFVITTEAFMPQAGGGGGGCMHMPPQPRQPQKHNGVYAGVNAPPGGPVSAHAGIRKKNGNNEFKAQVHVVEGQRKPGFNVQWHHEF